VHTLKLEGHESAYHRLGRLHRAAEEERPQGVGSGRPATAKADANSRRGNNWRARRVEDERGAWRTSGSAAGRCRKSSPAVGDGGGGGPANCGGDGGQTLSLSQSPGEERGSRSREADNV
jgi:hypothetical protein